MKPAFLFSTLSRKSRFIIAAGIYIAAALFQLPAANSVAARFFAAIILFIPLLFLAVKNFSLKPSARGGGEWLAAELKDIDRLTARIQKIKKIKIPFIYQTAFGVLISFAALIIAVIAFAANKSNVAFVIVDVYLIAVPALWFARIRKWYPAALAAKIKELAPAISYQYPSLIILVPSMFFAENDRGEKIPTDLKLSLEKKEKVNDFISILFHLSYNQGPNGRVPYVYAACVCEGCGKSWNTLKRLEEPKFITEASSSIENGVTYGVVTYRLDTNSRPDAYRTTEADILKLIGFAVSALERLQ